MTIDLAQPLADIILTVSDTRTNPESTLELKCTNHFSGDVFNYDLTGDISAYPERCSRFQVDMASFNSMKPGRYTYEVREYTLGRDAQVLPAVLENGILVVLGPTERAEEQSDESSEFVSINPDSTEETFISI